MTLSRNTRQRANQGTSHEQGYHRTAGCQHPSSLVGQRTTPTCSGGEPALPGFVSKTVRRKPATRSPVERQERLVASIATTTAVLRRIAPWPGARSVETITTEPMVTRDGAEHTFNSIECAIHALAAACPDCHGRFVGYRVEAEGWIFRCTHCAEHTGVAGLKDRA